MSDVLEIRRDERVLILTLNRPEKRNALNLELARALVGALDEADRDPGTGAVLIAANGKTFCAGMDLSEIGDVDSAQVDEVHESLFTSGSRLTKPIVAAVTGAALAGGTGLVANAHVAVAAKEATFGLTEIRIGLWPLLVFRQVALAVGERRAVEMSLTGRIVRAEEAWNMALVHEIAESPMERALEIARHLSRLSAFAIQNGLQYVNQARGRNWLDAGELARQTRARMLDSRDFKEGLEAFREKRSARWNSEDTPKDSGN
jgi:enoyl-CoA hydratase/carnithine racemase